MSSEVQIAVIDQQDTQIVLAVPGVQGATGSPISAGGTANQVLRKASSTNYDTDWSLVTNAMVDSSAAIAGTKISPNFGSQNVVTTGTSTAASFIPTSSSVPTNGVYLPSANNVAISSSGTQRVNFGTGEVVFNETGENYDFRIEGDTEPNLVFVDASTNRVGLGTSSPGALLHIEAAGNTVNQQIFTSDNVLNATASLTFGTTPGTRSKAAVQMINTNTGNAAGALALQTNGGSGLTTRLYINDSGQVGIGSTAPTTVLDVNTSSGGSQLRISNGTYVGYLGIDSAFAGIDYASQSGGHRFRVGASFTEAARIDSSGRLLVGTSSARANFFNSTATTQFQIEKAGGGGGASIVSDSVGDDPAILILAKSNNASLGGNTAVAVDNFLGTVSFQGNDGSEFADAARISCYVDGTPGANDMPGRLVFSVTRDGSASPTEALRISNTGATLSRTNSNAHVFSVYGDAASGFTNSLIDTNFSAYAPNDATACFFQGRDTVGVRAQIRSNGGLANYSANNVNLSDRNAKKDITPAVGTWDCLKEWEIVNFRYKDQPDDSDLNMGVIAQQVAESCPEVITVFQEATEDQPEKLGVKDQQMMWMAIKALQEAQLRIESLEAEVAALKAA